MKVNELFNCFSDYFDKILYYDETGNVQDTIYIENDDKYDEDEYNNFEVEYGDYEVTDWEYIYHGNYIDINIKWSDTE